MLPRKRKKFFGISKRKISLLSLVGVCLLTFPLPFISFKSEHAASKDQSTPFPCQNTPCGCRTAEQCWTTCCCNSPEQRLAWAKRNGVEPPSYAVLATSKDASVKSRACCSNCNKSATPKATVAEKPKSKRLQFLIGALVLKCHGQSGELSSMPWALVESLTVESYPILFSGRLAPIRILLPAAIYLDPAEPPPRAAA